MPSENISFNKNNKLFILQHTNYKQKSYGALSQKLHCRRHILFHRQTRRPKIASACRTYRLRGQHIWMYKQYPFETVAVCVLPNHIHAIWTLPPDDADYSLLRRLIKTKFSAYSPHTKNLSAGKQRRNERGIWQRRFYEHTVRDETDLRRCANHIRSNPIKQKMLRAETETGTILQKIISVFSNAILIIPRLQKRRVQPDFCLTDKYSDCLKRQKIMWVC